MRNYYKFFDAIKVAMKKEGLDPEHHTELYDCFLERATFHWNQYIVKKTYCLYWNKIITDENHNYDIFFIREKLNEAATAVQSIPNNLNINKQFE